MRSKSEYPLKIQSSFVVIITTLVFAFSIAGFREDLGRGLNIFALVCTTIDLFLMHQGPQHPKNSYLIFTNFLPVLMLGLGIFSLAWHFFYQEFIVNKIRLRYNKKVTIFSLNIIGRKIAFNLLTKNHQIIMVGCDKNNPYKSEVEKMGAIVLPNLQTDKNETYLLKEIFKIHNQIIPHNKLVAHEKEKDLNLFLLNAVKPNHN